MTDSLKKIFTGLIMYRHNLQCLHWNVKGNDFDPVHEKLDDYVGSVNGFIDDIAEITKMIGEYPLCLTCCIEMAKKDNTNYLYLECDKDFTTPEVWNYCKMMFCSMVDIYDIACRDGLPDDIVSKLQEHQYWFRKEGKYKGTQRTK